MFNNVNCHYSGSIKPICADSAYQDKPGWMTVISVLGTHVGVFLFLARKKKVCLMDGPSNLIRS